jgi:spore coat polysaccharide biosynthesis protein SpsF
MSARAAILLQARMGSARLPGKSLAPLEGRSMLAHCVDRLRARSELPVVVVTTTGREDDVLATEAARLDVQVVRGPADDVLARYVLAATTLGLSDLIRATADNPAVDMDAPRRTLELLRRTGAGYVLEHGLPYGAAVEAVSCAALRYADLLATEPYDREHVTPLLRRDRRFVALDALAPTALRRPELRFTVDTAEDLEAMRVLYAAVGLGPLPTTAFIAAADQLHLADRDEAGTGAR